MKENAYSHFKRIKLHHTGKQKIPDMGTLKFLRNSWNVKNRYNCKHTDRHTDIDRQTQTHSQTHTAAAQPHILACD